MVRPTKTLARDRLNTNERQEMAGCQQSNCLTPFTDEISNQLVLRTVHTTINDSNLEQIPLNRSKQLPAPYKLQENDWTTDNLTNNKRLLICDNRRIETHHSLHRVFIANNIAA